MSSALDDFRPSIREWFRHAFGEPTPPQERGWPPIQRGENTLILAPTGSGKTLAAFLWGIDRLAGELSGEEGVGGPGFDARGAPEPGVRIVYLSPLKALNNDIRRNLRVPLAGIRRVAEDRGEAFPEIRVALRSGDTPQRERRNLVNKPPHILITTPESLYLLLGSPRARQMFATVQTVIVDEIHTMAGSKRGVHLAVSLERLERLAHAPLQRIGLSATIRPLDEVARFLGGRRDGDPDAAAAGGPDARGETAPDPETVPRPVTAVDAAYDKPIDLRVESVLEEGMPPPRGSIWPLIVPRVADLVRQHETTLIFTNNRRLAERTADRLSEELAGSGAPGAGLMEDGVPKGMGSTAAGRGTHPEPVRAHHGSMSKEVRLGLERDLKAGRLHALVGTSSLELGIDIGSVDLVVQLQAPKGVAQGLQRIGRSGHLVGQTSRGRIFPSHREDLVEAAAVAGGMLRGEVEHVHTPRNALDVLAQHVVAAVSVEDWDAGELYRLVRRAYPYADLTERAYREVLEMLAGRYPSEAHGSLRPRISWDRVNDRLLALPGSRMLALTNGGTIPDTGMYGAFLPDRKTRIGELDEEFVFETRVGDTFMLGSQVWRVLDIDEDRVIVGEAPGAYARMPFWHGDQPWRQYELGRRVGALRAEVAEALHGVSESLGLDDLREVRDSWENPEVAGVLGSLRDRYALDENSARRLVAYVASQEQRGALATDRRIVVEVFDDALGDPRMVVHSPFGGRVNGPWGIVLADALRERTGVEVEVQSSDDGILLRFPEAEAEFPVDLVQGVGPEEARSRLLADLPNTAVFGARFRQNAARALLLPGLRGGRRTPFWLQRLRAKDLLEAVRDLPDFPLLAETYRDCLEDVMDAPALFEVLEGVAVGRIELAAVESLTPSPVAQGLLWAFTNLHLYEWDDPRGRRGGATEASVPGLLGDILHGVDLTGVLRPEAVAEVAASLGHTGRGSQARSAEELMLVLEELGDLTVREMRERSVTDPQPWLEELRLRGRVVALTRPADRDAPGGGPEAEPGPEVGGPLWVSTGLAEEYQAALGGDASGEGDVEEARRALVRRALAARSPLRPEVLVERYGLPEPWVRADLARREAAREVVRSRLPVEGGAAGGVGAPEAGPEEAYVPLPALRRMHRASLQLMRREVRPVTYARYAEFLAERMHLTPGGRLAGGGGLRRVLQELRGFPLPGVVWERDALPLRIQDYREGDLEALARMGDVIWVARGAAGPDRIAVRFFFRGEAGPFLEPAVDVEPLGEAAAAVAGLLATEGALFLMEIAGATGRTPAEVETALGELARAGLVTNDSFAAMRRVLGLGTGSGAPAQRAPSALEEQLRSRREGRTPGVGRGRPTGPAGFPGRGRPGRGAYRAASRRVRERLDLDPARESFLHEGRWALVHRLGVLGPALGAEEVSRRQARQLLLRWGVVSGRQLEQETGAWDRAAVFATLERMEMRGEVRRGYFVRGLPGRQYALAETLEALRPGASEGAALEGPPPLVVLNATDPAQLFGASAPEGLDTGGYGASPPRFARVPSTWVVQERGMPALVAEDHGVRILVADGVPAAEVRPALDALVAHLLRSRSRVDVESWDGRPVLSSPGREVLEELGFYRDRDRMIRERDVKHA